MTDAHVPAPALADLEAMKRAAAQRQFLWEHHDLISPWCFPLPIRTQLAMTRLVRGWQKCVESARGNQ